MHGADTLVLDTIHNYSYTFVPGGANDLTDNYTSTASSFFNDLYTSNTYTNAQLSHIGLTSANSVSDLGIYQTAGGLRNGDIPNTVFSMWNNIGTTRNLYQHDNNSGYRITLNGNADIKNHAISLGFEFDQTINTQYRLLPVGIWTQGRNEANNNLTEEVNNQSAVYTTVNGVTTISHPNIYTTPKTIGFYEKLRGSLGLKNTDYVDFDALSPDQLSLSFFTPDDLVKNNYLTSYYGYDYTGKKFDGNPAFKDYFTKKDGDGNYTREIGAFRPVYMAGYIQDKFAIDNLNFNVGVRVDRFDANQKQLKDKYLMSEV